jgi:hypothetical protein
MSLPAASAVCCSSNRRGTVARPTST